MAADSAGKEMEKERLDKRGTFDAGRKERQPGKPYKKNSDAFRSNSARDGRNNGDAGRKPGVKKEYQKRSPRFSQPYDKDSDYDKKDTRRKPQNTAKDKDSRNKEQQPDKMEVVKRLEKEKKAVQKKSKDNRKKNQQARPQVRVKRTNNIDWTKEYENDSFDDDDMYYSFR